MIRRRSPACALLLLLALVASGCGSGVTAASPPTDVTSRRGGPLPAKGSEAIVIGVIVGVLAAVGVIALTAPNHRLQ